MSKRQRDYENSLVQNLFYEFYEKQNIKKKKN